MTRIRKFITLGLIYGGKLYILELNLNKLTKFKLNYSAPEVFEEDSTLISTKSEIFSFGLVFYECLTCVPPNTLEMMEKKALDFEDVDCDVEEIEDEEDEGPIYGIRPPFPEDMMLTDDYNDILHIFNMCTDDDPEERPDAKKLENIFNELNIIVID